MLLLFISVMAPVVESNSIGMLHFLKNVSFTTVAAQSLVVPFPAPAMTFNVYVLSISVRNLDLLARLLKDWKSFVSMISAEAAVAPLHCLSRYRITLTVSEFRGSATPSDSTVAIWNRQPIDRIMHLRPTLVTSVTPCGILTHESAAIVPPVAIVASSMSRSWNFSSPPVLNLP